MEFLRVAFIFAKFGEIMNAISVNGSLELAKYIEEKDSQDKFNYLEAMKRLGQGDSFRYFNFSGGQSFYFGDSHPYSNSHGFGFSVAGESEEQLSQIVRFYKQFDFAPTISVTSEAVPASLKALSINKFSPVCFSNLMVFKKNNYKPESKNYSSSRITLSEVNSPEEIEQWKMVVSAGFAGRNLLGEIDPISLGQAHKKGNLFYLAHIDGELAGGACLNIDGTFARLDGMATLPKFRNHGIQRKLIEFRIQKALESNCEIIISDCFPNTTSFKNLIKNGFNLGYTRAIYRPYSL